MTTSVLIIIIASLITDIAVGGMAYKLAKSQEESIKMLRDIAASLGTRLSTLEEKHERDSNRNIIVDRSLLFPKV